MPAGGETLSEKPARPTSELTLRVISGLVMAAAVIGLTWIGGWPFRLLWLLAGLAVLYEWMRMTRAEPFGRLYGALAVLLVLSAWPAFQTPLALVGLGVVGLIASFVLARSTTERLWAFGGGLYAAVLVLVPASIRESPDGPFGASFGRDMMFWTYGVVWATDIAGYFVGRAVGGPKLWPRVSPKKTWSGFIGGVLFALVVSVGLAALTHLDAPRGVPWGEVMRIIALPAILASIISQGGDLAESALKRHFDVKDSSHLIPGHGGVMDRLDGFWAVCAGYGLLAIWFTVFP